MDSVGRVWYAIKFCVARHIARGASLDYRWSTDRGVRRHWTYRHGDRGFVGPQDPGEAPLLYHAHVLAATAGGAGGF